MPPEPAAEALALAADLEPILRARVAAGEGDPTAAALARHVIALGGGTVLAVVFFGSRRTGARPGEKSAYDLFVVVSAYRPFYAALSAAGAVHRAPGLLAALNAWLPPNQVAVRGPADLGDARAKCAVISRADLRRATSPRRRDHFCLGRLCQETQLLATAADGEAEALAALARAHALTWAWARPSLPERFDVDGYCRTFLRRSYAAEIRPEPAGRADAMWESQRAYLGAVYGRLLEALSASGSLVAAPAGGYALAQPVTTAERLRLAAYFRLSLVRATLRWAKYVVTFEGWLDFIVHKARRHSGQEIVLTERERRMPLVFLWPRLVRYLRQKDRGDAPR